VSLLAACGAALALFAATADLNEPRQVQIGVSAEERPIHTYAIGRGPHAVLVLGGIHGGSESNTVWLVWEMLDYFYNQPEAIPESVTLWFIPMANPDGVANGTRWLANGVDPNRNWPTEDWSPDTFAPGLHVQGGGGPEPLSEPETAAVARWIEHLQPVAILAYHSAAGLIMGGSGGFETGLVDAYFAASGYAVHDWVAYPVTGDFGKWAEGQGIPTLEVELTDHVDPEIDRNLAGIQAVLHAVAIILAADPSYSDR
jgi:hypothetical protein